MKRTACMPSISDDAVRAATGRDWAAWSDLLDRRGARDLDHRAIVGLTRNEDAELPGWWARSVALDALERHLEGS
jgi:hypothetical protein